MSLSSLLIDQLSALKKDEFDKVVKLYLKEVYGFKRVVNTDGPNDQGNDIQVFDLHDIKNQYQLTVQKRGFDNKLKQDLQKSKENHANHGFSNVLYFFYSRPLSNKQKNEFQKDALLDYGINLTLIDGNQIAEESAESYNAIASLVFELNGIQIEESEELFGEEDEKYKMLYDLLSFGSPSDIKGNMVKSFVLHLLFSEVQVTRKGIESKVNESFNIESDSTYSSNVINNLRQEGKIEIVGTNKNKFQLTKSEKSRLDSVISGFELTEIAFVDSVKEVLAKYNLEEHSIEVIKEIKNLFDSNYAVNIKELNSHNGDINSFEKASKKFKKYIYGLSKSVREGSEMVESLIALSENNDFLQKVSAGNFFASVVQSDRLSSFHRLYKSKNTQIFLDTQILLRAICTYYKPKIRYRNHYLQAARNLIGFAENQNLPLKTTYEYCKEVVHHFTNALNIIPFSKIKELNCLGESRNVFYKFYQYMRDNDQIESSVSFEAFIGEFGFRESSRSNGVSIVKALLKKNGIEVIDLPKEYSGIQPSKHFRNLQRFSFNRKKKDQAILFDSKMVEFLGDDDVDVQPVDPIFITWDHTFYKVRKKYFEENPNCTKWFMFTPSKFIDHFSLLDFQIQPSTLSNEILSILDEDSTFFNETQSLLDSIISIINPDDEVGLQYSNRLNELRNKEIKRVDEQPVLPSHEKDSVEEKPIAIDKIFFQLYNHYNKTSEGFDKYKQLFTQEEKLETFISLIAKEIEYFMENRKLSNKLVPSVTKLIENGKN